MKIFPLTFMSNYDRAKILFNIMEGSQLQRVATIQNNNGHQAINSISIQNLCKYLSRIFRG